MAKKNKRGARTKKPKPQRKQRKPAAVDPGGPTEAVVISDHGRKVATETRRRVSDAQLMRLLTSDQVAAAEELEECYRALCRSVGAKTASYEERVKNGSHREPIPSAKVSRYVRWGQACTRTVPMVDYMACRQVICDGAPFAVVDRDARRRHGWALAQVRRGLDLWDTLAYEERRARRSEPGRVGAQLGY